MSCQIVVGPQFQNITLKPWFLTCRRASENIDCNPTLLPTGWVGWVKIFEFSLNSVSLQIPGLTVSMLVVSTCK